MTSTKLFVTRDSPPFINECCLGHSDEEEETNNLALLEQAEEKGKLKIFGIYMREDAAKRRKKEISFKYEDITYCYSEWDGDTDTQWHTEFILGIVIRKVSDMYIVYKTLQYDIYNYEEQFKGDIFVLSLEEYHGFDEYTFYKTITLNQPININIQVEGCISSEFLYNEATKEWITPYWSHTDKFYGLLGADRVLAPVRTVLLIDFRLQWQEEIELVTEDTRQIAHKISLPTLPTEIWFEILRMLKVRHFGVSLI